MVEKLAVMHDWGTGGSHMKLLLATRGMED